MTSLDILKMEAREGDTPYFSDEELQYYLDKNNNDINLTVYELLIIKSQDSTIKVSGLTTTDTSAYFKRLAARYKSFNSGTLGGD